MRGFSGPSDTEQHLHHKPRAWNRESMAVLMFGDLVTLPVLKMSVWKKGKEICPSQHFQIPQSCCFPSFPNFSGEQLLSTLKCWGLLVSARAQGNASEGLNNRWDYYFFLAAKRRLSNPLEFYNVPRIH